MGKLFLRTDLGYCLPQTIVDAPFLTGMILMENTEAKVALCKCKECYQPFGVRFERHESSWIATWAFPIKKEGSGTREGYGTTKIVGSLEFGREYPGCPYCGSNGFIICGNCGKLSCYVRQSDCHAFTCNWCGKVFSEISDYDGSGFKAASDI